MENTVAQVSRYLDRIGAPLATRKHGLLLVAFCRALRRYAAKSSRLELVARAVVLVQVPMNLPFQKARAKFGSNTDESLLTVPNATRQIA
jgi:hypothetical protein